MRGEAEGKRDATAKRIGRSFAIAAREVTVARSFSVSARNRRLLQSSVFSDSDCPVTPVSCDDAAAYCNWLSKQEGVPKTSGATARERGIRRGDEAGTELTCNGRVIVCRARRSGGMPAGPGR